MLKKAKQIISDEKASGKINIDVDISIK